MSFNIHRAYAIARKEVMHVLRDPFTLALALGLPVMLVTFFGYAIDFEVKDISLAVSDRDNGPAARRLKEIFSSSGYFYVVAPAAGAGPVAMLDSERASAALFIEPGFSKKIKGGDPAEAQFVLDGSDNSKAAAVLGYLPGIQRAAQSRLADPAKLLLSAADPLSVETRFLYNPELNSRWFTVPGLAAIIIGLLAIMLTALTVAREWENGSMELLLSTPVRPLEIIAGKLLPYGILVLAGVFFVYLVSRLVFGVPFAGSHLLYLAACLLFITAALSQGLLISVLTRQQQVAMQFGMITGLLPSMLLSGFIFPVESMPAFFQYLTMLLPPRWFMAAARGITLKGADLVELAVPFLALGLLSAGMLALALKKFKTDLE
ncbi:MAG: multidrug ABC transporter permease [Elusimicrobia bacterium GWA2_56_46]|nr:MAG: multidrug ABC transporter permease [Elusimicrobia bacterium GWA2_56_46]OGR54622.1 MAG: multidrug ABC transporter permease [Elusimicrobia bacterium GWC2_56_31]HBB67936.1 ABC transporter permease [Elusimicrobiota bacterium]HBW23895.1 ABC transporter permease [Elusimicrobiota bacterium]